MSARIKPHKVKGRQLEEVREKDPDGRIVVHHRTVDTLGKMLQAERSRRPCTMRRGTFRPPLSSPARPTAGDAHPARAGHRARHDLSERQLHARQRVHEAMQALGGISSPAGSCAWHVAGLQQTIREWAMRQGWGGRPLHVQQAQGIALGGTGPPRPALRLPGSPCCLRGLGSVSLSISALDPSRTKLK